MAKLTKINAAHQRGPVSASAQRWQSWILGSDQVVQEYAIDHIDIRNRETVEVGAVSLNAFEADHAAGAQSHMVRASFDSTPIGYPRTSRGRITCLWWGSTRTYSPPGRTPRTNSCGTYD